MGERRNKEDPGNDEGQKDKENPVNG